jgi:electron transfer flavoprotein-quinone oxidoreductase
MRYNRLCVAHILSPPPEMEERYSISSGPSRRMGYPEARDFFTVGMLRREFDQWLAKRARAAGARLMLESLVTGLRRDSGRVAGVVLDGGEEFAAPVVIGADGVLSATARFSGLREKWRPDQVISACAVDFAAPQDRMDDVIHEAGFQAYFGPVLGGHYLVASADGVHLGGPGVTNSLISRLNRTHIKPARELMDSLGAPPTRRLLRALDAVPREWQAHLLPWMDRMPTDIYTGGLMLVGDAAGLPEPLYAEGVWQAMYSGRLAAQVAMECSEEKDVSAPSLRRYLERLEESPVGREFVGGAELRRLFEILGDPRLSHELTELAVDLTVNLFMSAQEPKAECVARALPLLAENLPVLMEVARIYLPMVLEVGAGRLRGRIAALRCLSALLSGTAGEGSAAGGERA